MGEAAPKIERTPEADIRHAFRTILKPQPGDEGTIHQRNFGQFDVRRGTIMVGYRRDVPKTTYELYEAAPTAAESRRYSYQTVGHEMYMFIDGQRVQLEEGLSLFQSAINRALETYQGGPA